ncbi:helix-turn-helix domain-containing protein [Streptomyces griseoviridis]|uniref:PucR family transcriptional regulator n=1 Tax=Streptomyces griseoviridis TaxID=45398 RepID=UPI00344DF2DC
MDLLGGGDGNAPVVPLRALAAALGAAVVLGGAKDTDVSDVIITEPGETPPSVPRALVLAVGARADAAVDAVTSAGKAGVSAVAVRLDEGASAVPEALRVAAEASGVAVLGIPSGTRWERVETEARRIRHGGPKDPRPVISGDLFSLAQTVATLSLGVVSIEDNGHRVLAYAGPGDEADELRRQSILGRQCPEPYLALLREWGVYRRARSGGEVVEVEARPDKGVRRRLVIGIGAGGRPLGTIWVQEGSRPLAPSTEQTLRGAARLAAPQLIDHYYEGDATARLLSRSDLAHSLLTGRFNSAALAAHFGIEPSSAAAVVAFDLRERPDGGESGGTSWREARRAEAAEIIAVHAAAGRKNALVAQACGQIYAMLPEPPAAGAGHRADAPDAVDAPLVRWATEVVSALRRHTDTPVQAVVAGTAAGLEDIPAVKLRGHHGLQIMARTPERAVAAHRDLAASLMVRDLVRLLEEHQEIREPALQELVVRDAEQGTQWGESLLRYLDAFGDVSEAARTLNIHPNTLRYRVRKAAALTGLDLDDPEHRLVAMVQLRLGRLPSRQRTDPFPAS